MKPHDDQANPAIHAGPLAMLAAGLLLAALPLASHMPLFAFAMFLAALVVRASIQRMQLRLPSLAVKLVVLLLGVGGVRMSSGTLLGIESSMGILLILVSLKLLELHTVRDFQVLVLLGWFLGLCRLFFSQDLASWLQSGIVGLLLTIALVSFHSGSRIRWESARTAAVMVAQAVPLVALLFVLFPRGYTGVRFSFSRGLLAGTGLANRLEPGGFAGLAQNDATAFRVEFPGGAPPPPERRYWRAAVLWHGEGLVWTRGQPPRWAGPQEAPGVPRVRQHIVLVPHGGRWLFALDWPVGNVKDATYEAGEFFQASRPVLQPLSYEVESVAELNPVPLPKEHRDAALQRPMSIPVRTQALVKEWRGSLPDDLAFVQHALRWIHDESFSYTLSPGDYDEDGALDEFLFDRREGFCEHYAAAFATLMRLGGVPARIVIGYHGGEFNDVGNYVRVKQSDAHAWCEVWLEGRGWTRIDPTAMIAPDRVAAGLQSLLESRAARDDEALAAAGAQGGPWANPFRQARMFWDNLNFQWDLRVLNYDDEEQQSFLAVLGFRKLQGLVAIGVVLLVLLIGAAVVAVILRRPWRHKDDPVVQSYLRFCRALAAAGLAREPWEGPLEFAGRAMRRYPEHAAFIQRATDLYISVRYSAVPRPARDFVREMRALPRFQRLPEEASAT